MKGRSSLDYLEDIRREAERARRFLGSAALRDLEQDGRTAYAVVRCLELIGEAATQVSPNIRERFPNVPWRAMTGIRNKLIHGHLTVDLTIVFETVVNDLPKLLPQIDAMPAALRTEEP